MPSRMNGTKVESVASPERLPILVKNTFIDVMIPSVECRPQRRSSSLPPSLRSAEAAKPDAERWDSDDSTDLCTEVSDDDISTPSPAACVAGLDTSAVVAAPPAPAPSAGSPVAAPRSRLNAKAQAWQPGAAAAAPPVLVTQPGGMVCQPLQANVAPFQPLQPNPVHGAFGMFNHHTGEVVAVMKAALETCPCANFVEAAQHAQGWTVSVHVNAEELIRTEYILRIAKESLLNSTSKNAFVKVMGERLTPFLPAPQGFMATLGAVVDSSKACYDAYGKGFCRRGHACRWQHPPCMGSIQVLVVAPPLQSR